MSELFGKLTNLSYEFFGVLMPGVIAHIFFLVAWAAMGPLAPVISLGGLPQLRFVDLVSFIDSAKTERGIGMLLLLLVGWYFLGHLVLWISRSRERTSDNWPSSARRTWLALTLRTPRPKDSFDPKLQPLLDLLRRRFERGGVSFDWRQFYPVAKNFLAQRVAYSLVATYQHKYTLHRSIACAAALQFWALIATAAIGLRSLFLDGPQPHWHLLIAGTIVSLLLVWGFSGSYMYNWLMFGNTIITECYALLNAPKVDLGSKSSSSN
jgi:hypothetical protein